jgi:hypothetical protein
MTRACTLRSRMQGNSHVRFWRRAGAGDCSCLASGDTLLLLGNETGSDPSRGQRLIDVVACAFVVVRTQVDDEEGWWVLTHGLLPSCCHVLPPATRRAMLLKMVHPLSCSSLVMHIPSFPLYQSGQVQSLIALACETPFCLVTEVEATG